MALTKAKGHILADDLALGGNPTTSTQSASDNSTKIATTAYVTTAVSNLVDGAPSTLNTLNEIAAALNDDAALNTTLTNSIATKLPLAGGTLTGDLVLKSDGGDDVLNVVHSGNTVKLVSIGQSSDNSGNGVIQLKRNNGVLHAQIHSHGNTYFNGGNVGIGFASGTPARALSTKSSSVTVASFESTSSTAGLISFVDSNTTDDVHVRVGAVGDNLVLQAGGSERMRIDNTGKVRIGATLGLNHLLNIQTASSSGLAQIEFRNTQAGTQIGMPANTNALSFFTADAERMRFTSAGAMEIKGTSTTSQAQGFITNDNSVLSIGSSVSGSVVKDISFNSPSAMMYIDGSAGSVGIGTTAPTQKLEVAGTALLENAKLKAIAASNSTTVTDLFIYDTTKDSDGGAWRKKIKHTAWYNEATSATRSSRKEFPSIAVLAFNTNQELYIYDGDDPDLGLWAKYTNFTQDSGGFASITAVNGSIYAAQAASTFNFSGNGYFQLNFAADYFFSNIISVFSTHKQGRADGLLTTYDYRPRGDRDTPKYALVTNGYQISDMAVKVLDNATIDTETGLPKPNIALAGYYGGLSVVKDTGVVVDITASAGAAYSGVTWVDITKNDNLIFEQDNSSNPRSIFCIPIPGGNRTSATSDGIINDKVVMKFYRGGTHKPYPVFNGGGVNEAVALEGDNQLLKSSGGDLTILEPNLVSPAYGKVAYIGHDYNSGWLVGDTKVATLSDTSTTSATSPDLVTNGSNFSNTTGWTGHSATVSVSNSELLVTGTATGAQNQSAAWTTISCTAGDQFQVTFRISAFVANQSSAGIIVGGATIHKNNDAGYWYPNTTATHTTTVTATSSTFTLYLHAGVSVGVVTRFDDISIHKLQHDRSQYKNGFQTFGTLPKSVVATGAELVGYGPFSSSNYLQQSYTSELDFNSGDFAYCFWVYNDFATTSYVADRSEGNGNYRTALYMTSTNNGTMYLYTRDGGAYTEAAGIIGTPNKWAQIWCIRRGNSHEIWVNGIQKVTAVDTNGSSSAGTTGTVRDISYASGDAIQKIGVRFSNVSANTGKIALFRISGTAPSEEQIVKIYNDERKLFEINSDATMGGSSSAATVLAYDDVREEIHVGSSWGRSVFQGLSRVGFDSDVATASLSVNDGFVVEE